MAVIPSGVPAMKTKADVARERIGAQVVTIDGKKYATGLLGLDALYPPTRKPTKEQKALADIRAFIKCLEKYGFMSPEGMAEAIKAILDRVDGGTDDG